MGVPRPHENGRRTLGTVAPAGSTRREEVKVVITNLIVIELRSERVRRYLDLCDREDSLRGVKEQMDTSRSSSSLRVLDLSRPSVQ